MSSTTSAPGWPGIQARWTSSAKNGIGFANVGVSPVWFTISHGILNEVYYPRSDQAMIRDTELIVTSDDAFFSEEKRDASHEVSLIKPGIPAYVLTNTDPSNRYRIRKRIVTDPSRPVVLQHVEFTALAGKIADYRIYTLLSPHIANRGAGNTGWVGEYKGRQALMASRDGYALALMASVPFKLCSVGYVGTSDGWQDLVRNRRLTSIYDRAENGNIALTAEIDAASGGGEFLLALGFGRTADEAGHQALASIYNGFDKSFDDYAGFWNGWSKINGRRKTRPAFMGSAGPFLNLTSGFRSPEASSPAYPSPGDFQREMTIWAVTIWYGREIWSRPDRLFLPPALTKK